MFTTTHYALETLTPEDVFNVIHYYHSTDPQALDNILAIAQSTTTTQLTKADIGAFVEAILAYHFIDAEELE